MDEGINVIRILDSGILRRSDKHTNKLRRALILHFHRAQIVKRWPNSKLFTRTTGGGLFEGLASVEIPSDG